MNWATYDQKYIDLQVKYPLFLSDFNVTCIFSTEKPQILNSIKICPVGADLVMRTDGQKDRHMTMLIVSIQNFANAREESSVL